jgi:hypothetical protein
VPDYETGFVYVMSNPAMPDMLKIGVTTSLPEDRAMGLSSRTGVPLPFGVKFRALTMRWRQVERLIHDRLAAHRVNKRREFFMVPLSVAVEAVRDSVMAVNGMATWQQGSIHPIDGGDRIVLPLQAGQIFVLLDKPLLIDDDWTIVDLWQAHVTGDQLEIFGTTSPTDVAAFSAADPEGTSDPIPFLNRAKDAPNGGLNGKEVLTPGDRLLWLADTDDPNSCESVILEARAYCQVLSRTWNPRVTPEGFPFILNVLARDPSPAMLNATRYALARSGPRTWAPRRGIHDPAGDRHIAAHRAADYWLPQLRPRKR